MWWKLVLIERVFYNHAKTITYQYGVHQFWRFLYCILGLYIDFCVINWAISYWLSYLYCFLYCFLLICLGFIWYCIVFICSVTPVWFKDCKNVRNKLINIWLKTQKERNQSLSFVKNCHKFHNKSQKGAEYWNQNQLFKKYSKGSYTEDYMRHFKK